ncbi:hypothetical protein C8R45DRAFT_1164663 [Mycena sanguinolenta]|nr:hypothetical protein C8R45DRAFT_1164663 [Mycena sanguinolenta]
MSSPEPTLVHVFRGQNTLSQQEMTQIALQTTCEHQIRLESARREFLNIFRAVGTGKCPFWVTRLGPVRTKTALPRRNLSGQKQANLDFHLFAAFNECTSNAGGRGGSGGQGGSGGTGEGPIVHLHFPNSPVVQASRLLNHCPPPSRIFHGRRTILEAMHQFFAQDTGKQKIFVLFGLGGAGKTQIALKFIEEWTRFTDRLLVDTSTTETVETGLKNIASTKQTGNSVQDAMSWLLNNQNDWLLFFDNADDPEINLNQFFPKCTHGNIIITSRNPNLRGYGAHFQVSDMDEADAVELLLKSAHHKVTETNKLHALDIVKALWYLPLAIVQAGAFILESGCLDTYLHLFVKNRTELLKKKSTQNQDDYAWAVYTTWEMSFHKLSNPAAMLLQLCSFLHREDIFEEIFSRAANYLCQPDSQSSTKSTRLQKLKSKFMKILQLGRSRSESLPEVEITKASKFLSYFVGPTGDWDSFSFLTVTNEIRAYSLMNFDLERKSFSIHPLVHSWSQTTLDDPEPYHSCIDCILGTSIKEIPQQDMQLASLRLVSHVDSIISKSTHFGRQYATIYYYVGRHTDAEDLDVKEVEKQNKLLGEDHPDTLTAKYNLAITYRDLGRFEQAEKLQMVILEKRRKLLGHDHLLTLTAVHNLAITYYCLGRSEEAEKLQVVVLEKRRKLLGDDHPNTLSAILGRFDKAEQLQIVVVEKRRNCLGDAHLYTVNAMYRLARTHYTLGRFAEAEQLQGVVLKMRRKLLGDDHLDTLNTMHNLAITYSDLGRLNDAEKLQVIVLEKQRKLLGDAHLNTLEAMNNLGWTYYCQGHFVKAEELQVVVLERRRRLLGDDHQETQRAMRNLVQTYHSLGRGAEAVEVERLIHD